MKPPKFSPKTWVTFKIGDGAAFGKIKGGNYNKETGWIYYVKNAMKPEEVFTVAEVDITAESDGSDWTVIQ